MIVYAIVLLLTAALLAMMGFLIYRGKTNLIHDYHQTRVVDPVAYGKAFGKSLGIIALFCALSGAVSLFGTAAPVIWLSLGLLFAGLTIGILCLVHVQKKYNGGVF